MKIADMSQALLASELLHLYGRFNEFQIDLARAQAAQKAMIEGIDALTTLLAVYAHSHSVIHAKDVLTLLDAIRGNASHDAMSAANEESDRAQQRMRALA